MPPIEVIINEGSGSVLGEETSQSLRERFIAYGIRANVHLAKNGADIESLAKHAVEGDAEIVVAGGGDGTISTVAAEVAKAGKILGVLPLGTLNNFSKDLGIPQDLKGAVRVIAVGETVVIDLAEVNGRMFINNSSIGLYPRIVLRREKDQRLGRGKWNAAFWAALRMFRLSPFLKVRIELDGRQFLRKTPFVFVGNNEYEMELYNIGRRPALDEGKLSVYFLHRGGRWGVLLLLVHTVFGRLKQWKDFEEISTEEITIQTRKKRLHVAFDGEVRTMETPLHYKIRPGALKVIVPGAEAGA
ncbi:MAG: diacylglycerol kinase family lipid kinase [Saprospiraceae bacterium]|nr:diacylglycerol kinase family lipid kinase [Pyrinomonadaceae bacterium]